MFRKTTMRSNIHQRGHWIDALTMTAVLAPCIAQAQVGFASYSVASQCHRTDPASWCIINSDQVPVSCDCDFRLATTFNGVPVEYQSVGTGRTSGGPAPMADVQGAVTNSGYCDIRSDVQYFGAVFPRTPSAVGRVVPVLVRVRGSVTATSSGRVRDASYAIATSQMCVGEDVCVRGMAESRCPTGQECDGPRGFDVFGVLNILVEETGGYAQGLVSAIVTMGTQPTTAQDVFGNVGAQAVADPTFEIDPTYEFRDEYYVVLSRNLFCPSDFNTDGIVDFFDYLDFVLAFSAAELAADYNLDGVVDFFDYLDFVQSFSSGC